LELLFDGGDIRVALSRVDGSPNVVATFSNFTAGGHEDYFGQGYLERRGFSVLYFVARQSIWWQTPEMATGLAAARTALAGLGQPVVTYGSSMGGYGALLFARDLGATHIVAASPQVTIGNRMLLKQEWSTQIDCQPILRDDIEATLGAAAVDVIFDPAHRMDRAHVEILDRAAAAHGVTCRHYVTPFGGHNSLEYLRRAGILSTIAHRLIAGTLPVAEFRTQVRATRRENAEYCSAGRALLLAHGKPNWAARLADPALAAG
jgi:hypothetical protein